jgi:hypothetical protein
VFASFFDLDFRNSESEIKSQEGFGESMTRKFSIFFLKKREKKLRKKRFNKSISFLKEFVYTQNYSSNLKVFDFSVFLYFINKM